MAWITKKSGSLEVEKRSQPYLTDEVKKKITEVYLPRYETKHGALIPALHAVQESAGWLPHQALMEVAEFLELKPADVLDTASFYEEFWLKRKGEHVIAVCRSIACEFCGQKEVTEACKKKLGIDVGETTEDGKFTLIELECLGACGGAPAALVDHTLHEFIRPDQVARLIDDAAKGGHGHH